MIITSFPVPILFQYITCYRLQWTKVIYMISYIYEGISIDIPTDISTDVSTYSFTHIHIHLYYVEY